MMNIQRKLELVEQNIKSISTHDDHQAAVLLAALDKVEAIVKQEREVIESRTAAAVQREIDGS